jgi:hypothetical protein
MTRALARSIKKADTSGRMIKAVGAAPDAKPDLFEADRNIFLDPQRATNIEVAFRCDAAAFQLHAQRRRDGG